MKKLKYASCIALIVLIMIGACGCMNTSNNSENYTNAEYSAAIEKYLFNKYSMSFKVDSLGGTYGTADNTTVKAWCYCVTGDYADIKFMAEIKKDDLDAVKDNFLHVVSADMISNQLCNGREDAVACSVVESSMYSSANNVSDLSTYLAELETYFVTTHFFVKDIKSASVDDYTDAVFSVAEIAKQLNLSDICIVVWFVDEMSTDMNETFKNTSVDKLYDTFMAKDYVNSCATIQLLEGEILTDRETIQSSLEKGVK